MKISLKYFIFIYFYLVFLWKGKKAHSIKWRKKYFHKFVTFFFPTDSLDTSMNSEKRQLRCQMNLPSSMFVVWVCWWNTRKLSWRGNLGNLWSKKRNTNEEFFSMKMRNNPGRSINFLLLIMFNNLSCAVFRYFSLSHCTSPHFISHIQLLNWMKNTSEGFFVCFTQIPLHNEWMKFRKLKIGCHS